MNEEIRPKSRRTRSPAYPAIDLEEALQKATVLWDKVKRHLVNVNDAVKFWGYEASSSSGHSAVSALKKYGLVQEEGSGEARQVRLTDFGIGLVFNSDPNSPDFREGLKEAALRPVIHSELWSRYGGELPDDAVVERFLVLERGFNTQYVKTFINQFRNTIAFAGLTASDKQITKQSEEVQARPGAGKSAAMRVDPVGRTYPRLGSVISQDTRREFTLPMPNGDITIRGPFPISRRDWETFKKTIDLFEGWLVASEKTEQGTEQPEEKS
jgi:hypothetical protein